MVNIDSTSQRTYSPSDLCIHQWLKVRAEQAPDTIALMAPGRAPLTYSRLYRLVDDVVKTLNAMGVGRNDRVAIVLPNGPEMAAAFLAVAAGATSAPLNPTYREKEFDFYLSDLCLKALIIHSGINSPARSVAKARAIPILELSPVGKEGIFTLGTAESSVPACKGWAGPEDVALVLHTSGTTSRPKMVPLTQRNLSASAYHIAATLGLTEKDRCLNVMPLFHIHGLTGAVLSSLAAGGSVVCTPGFDVSQFFSWSEEFRPTWYTAVPTMHQALLSLASSNHAIVPHSSLRFIRSSSAPLVPKLMEQLEQVFGVPVIESYGMTEAAHQITSNPLPPRKRKPGSVGVAAGPEVAVMGEESNLLPLGNKGEIVIRGANVTRGYESNPTANSNPTHGWFRTGDQGYLDADGYLFITGRLKEIINRGGEKVSPREIDEALLDHPAVCEAVAFSVAHGSLGEDIAAAVVVLDKERVTEPMIREHLFGRLADFKIPSQILIVDEIPKGATGKVQRIGLAERFAQQLKREFVAPKSKLEAMVASIYGDVLGMKRVSTADNFFALGGDSLRATQVISRVCAALLVNLPIVTLFKKPTVAELADEIARSTEAIDPTLIAGILAELRNLSEEDTQRLLAAEVGHPSSK
jgi:acyl-CoA synthetase (AMP-forming)/AMP-acid ligase II/acyl carrier protein